MSTAKQFGLLACTMPLWALGGCAPEVPATPTWTEDVRPLLMANCARCHTDPPIQGAPSFLRLDSYEDWPNSIQDPAAGAATLVESIIRRGSDEDNPMPPLIGPLNDRQIELLENWAQAGTPRGEPMAGNTAPEVTIQPGQIDQANQTVTIQYEITDVDDDFVLAALRADDGTESVLISATLRRGAGEVVWDITDVPGATYDLSVELDDGSTHRTVDFGTYEIPAVPVPRQSAPTITLPGHGAYHDSIH